MKEDACKLLLDNVFLHPFDKTRFSQFIVELFNDFELRKGSWAVWKEYQEYIESYESLGTYNDVTKNKIEVLIVKLRKASSRDRARTMQRNFIAKFLKNSYKNAALVAFYGDDPSDWRFSFVKMEYILDKKENGRINPVEELTPAKRYSFLVGENEPNHTCRRQFLPLVIEEQKNPTLQDIESCFSVEKVTEEFYEEYKRLYLDLKRSLESTLKQYAFIQREFTEKNISTIDFSKKLLGQIVFLYFLQKKGWLGIGRNPQTGEFAEWGSGPKNFMRQLFEKKIVPYDNFFNDILEPLFYEALADDRSANNDYYSRFKCKIPFLNGGLFEPINDYNWVDSNISLDNSIFKNIFDTFDRYNFTVKEDEPLEREVAVDPEILGQVFEKLLEIEDRKSKGAFYTPRQIVHYMCQQCLIGYLENNSSLPREDLEKFVQLGDFALGATIQEQADIHEYGRIVKTSNQFALPVSIKQNYELLDRLLKEVKIVDPAVGSGAFPVGMMIEVVKARSILTPFFSTGKANRTHYEIKRETIENSLYGVDIDSSAVDIAKLRFWLSLIVDEENIKNIRPLPNLDHKIMCGDSLVEEFEGVKLFDESLLVELGDDRANEIALIDEKIAALGQKLNAILTGKDKTGDSKSIIKEINKLQNEKRSPHGNLKKNEPQLTIDQAITSRLKKSRHKLTELKRYQRLFFNEQNRTQKQEYRNCIEKLEWDLIEETLKETGKTDACKKLIEYRKNKHKPFFIWKLYFAEIFQRSNAGFDIVIANPPYIDSERMVNEMPEVREKISKLYKSAGGNWDYYIPFYELGINLARKKGIVSFISPNKWLSISYGQKLRNIIGTQFFQICDCSEIKVFKNAGNSPIIAYIEKGSNKNIVFIHYFNENRELCYRYKIKNEILIESDNWGLLLSKNIKLIEKIYDAECKVENYCDVENPFSVSEAYELIPCLYSAENKIHSDDLKFINTGTIERYFDLWGLKTTSYIKKKYEKPYVDVGKFSSILPKRYTQSITKKIIIKGIRQFKSFLDYKGEYVAGKSTIIIKEIEGNSPIETIIAFLNSKLITFYINEAYSALGIDGGINFSAPMIKRLPIPKISKSDSIELYNLVKQINENISIIKSNGEKDKSLINQEIEKELKDIDKIVFKLYGLIDEEIKIIEK